MLCSKLAENTWMRGLDWSPLSTFEVATKLLHVETTSVQVDVL
jgi:hypothetical protein